MTPELAAEKAADMLDLATDDIIHGDIVENRIAIADAWMRLHTALANAPKTIEPAAPIAVLRTDGETAFEFHGERWRIVASNFRHNDLGGESELTLRIVPDERHDDDAITDQGVIDVDPAPLISYYEARRHH